MRLWLGLLLFLSPAALLAQPRDAYFTMAHSKAQAMGMAGAVTAVEAGLSAVHFNPAAFRLARVTAGLHVSVFLSPLSSFSLYHHYSSDARQGMRGSDWLNVLRVLPKAVVVSLPHIELAVVAHEELDSRKFRHSHRRFFEADSFFHFMAHTGAVRVRLADQFFVGGSVSYYVNNITGESRRLFGSSYGIRLLPSDKFSAGIVFVDIPSELREERLINDRFEDESVNIGVAYHPFPNSTLALDVRNISEDGGNTTREWHLGVAQSVRRHLDLRGGFYRSKVGDVYHNHFALGLGVLDLNMFRGNGRKFLNPVMALNYALMIEKHKTATYRSHFLSLNLVF